MKPWRHITVYVPAPRAWQSQILRGVARYALTAGRWVTHVPEGEPFVVPDWPCDGVILGIIRRDHHELAERLSVPVVNVSGTLAESPWPQVTSDYYAVGRTAAEHLLTCGLRHFAFLGWAGSHFSDLRQRGFADRLADAGFRYIPMTERVNGLSWPDAQAVLRPWLAEMPLPLGLAAVNDYWAHVAMETARQMGLRIAQDLAVVGIGDDPVYTRLCNPMLSSVRSNEIRRGYQAAALLDRLLDGEAAPDEPVLIAPAGVARRGSTDTLACEDPDLAAALHFVERNRSEPITVADILRAVPVSRRALEMKFQRHLGHSPHEAIWRAHVAHAQQLLVETDLNAMQVAVRSGFASASALASVFKRRVGMTPMTYRRRHRTGEAE